MQAKKHSAPPAISAKKKPDQGVGQSYTFGDESTEKCAVNNHPEKHNPQEQIEDSLYPIQTLSLLAAQLSFLLFISLCNAQQANCSQRNCDKNNNSYTHQHPLPRSRNQEMEDQQKRNKQPQDPRNPI